MPDSFTPRSDPGGSNGFAALRGIRVLIVEDDALLRASLVSFLEAAGADALAAPDAEEAIRCLDAGPLDLVLTDLQLPGQSGIDLAEWVLANRPIVPVVLMSASLPASTAVLPASVRRFVLKPFEADTLLAILVHLAKLPSGDR